MQKAKHDGVTAVDKLRKCEEDLSHIKEKNAQLSDEILSKSRQITALENGAKTGGVGGALRKTSLPAGPASMASVAESKLVADLRKQVADLEQKVASSSGSGLVNGGGARKKSVKFAGAVSTTNARCHHSPNFFNKCFYLGVVSSNY